MQPNAYLPTASAAALATSKDSVKFIQPQIRCREQGKTRQYRHALRIGPCEHCKRESRANHKPKHDISPFLLLPGRGHSIVR